MNMFSLKIISSTYNVDWTNLVCTNLESKLPLRRFKKTDGSAHINNNCTNDSPNTTL